MLKIIQGDCNRVMRTIRKNTIDTIITDPPYALKFMGKEWDYELPSVKCFKRMLRIAKPGAILLCFGGTRTFHRMTCNIEDAGWIIKDCIMWIYGSGFPKSHNIGKAIKKNNPKLSEQWESYGSGLKPAFEPIIVAMKPLDGTYAQNAEKWGVAGLNIDGGRIAADCRPHRIKIADKGRENATVFAGRGSGWAVGTTSQGRWPANIILDEEAEIMLDKQTGFLPGPWGKRKSKTKHGKAMFNPGESEFDNAEWQSKNQGASRFFYTAKASKKERNLGLEKLQKADGEYLTKRKKNSPGTLISGTHAVQQNTHPTVKPISLMKYLCKLTKTPLGGLVLDPFAGTGTTGIACKLTGRHFIGIELDKYYCEISKLRMKVTKRIKPKHGILKKKIFKA